MTWNHRVTRQIFPGEEQYAIREVYYDENGKIIGWTEDITGPAGETVEELRDELERMMVATLAPVIDITDEDNPFIITKEDSP